MNTFLPYRSFEKSALVLDYKRHGKQRIEAVECLSVISDESLCWMSEKQFAYIKRRYQNGPVVAMWKNYPEALKHYTNCMITSWVNKGYNNSIELFEINWDKYEEPWWLGKEKLHACYRATLLWKAYNTLNGMFIDWYNQWNWCEEPKWGYWWPDKYELDIKI